MERKLEEYEKRLLMMKQENEQRFCDLKEEYKTLRDEYREESRQLRKDYKAIKITIDKSSRSAEETRNAVLKLEKNNSIMNSTFYAQNAEQTKMLKEVVYQTLNIKSDSDANKKEVTLAINDNKKEISLAIIGGILGGGGVVYLAIEVLSKMYGG